MSAYNLHVCLCVHLDVHQATHAVPEQLSSPQVKLHGSIHLDSLTLLGNNPHPPSPM